MQPVRVKVSNQYFMTPLNWNLEPSSLEMEGTLSVFNHPQGVLKYLFSPLGIMWSKRLGWPLHSFTFTSSVFCSSWLLQRVHCPIIPEPGLLPTATGVEARWLCVQFALCSLWCSGGCCAFFFPRLFVNPVIMKQLLEKITCKHRLDWPGWFTISFFF